jgi:hypothetical protein
MNQGTLTLLVGALLAVAALAFVLYPLFFEVREAPRARASAQPADDSAIVALREIEFDKATGKLSDADYAELKQSYSARALSELRARDRASGHAEQVSGPPERSDGSAVPVPSDPIEARIREVRETHRACRTCGVRPEADAVYCSTCGSYLDRDCPRCSAPVTEAAAAFCPTCGLSLAGTAALV